MKRLRLLVTLAWFVACSQSRADILLVAPAKPATAGGEFSVTLYLNNETTAEKQFVLPQPVRARLTWPHGTAALELRRDAPKPATALTLAPQSFQKIPLLGTMPTGAVGVVSLELLEPVTGRIMFEVAPAPPAAPAPIAEAAKENRSGGADAAKKPDAELEKRHPPKLSTYEPVYFSVGWRDFVNAKFQISAKFRFFDDDDWVGKRVSFADELHLGYTQTSLWDLESPSAPFHDSSYRPAVFYLKEDTGWKLPGVTRFGVQFGPEHESNGKAGDDSRSINILFAKPIFDFGDPEGYHFTLAPKAYLYLEKSDNPDIDRYRGYVDLMLRYGKKGGLMISATGRVGNDLDHGSVQIDASYPLLRSNYGPFLHFQYFNGWGETILDYNRKFTSQFRVGLMLVQ